MPNIKESRGQLSKGSESKLATKIKCNISNMVILSGAKK
jgi:hypothetical protein